MTITTSNDAFTYKSPRGDTERPADLVGAILYGADGVPVDEVASTATVTSVNSAASSTSLLAANTARRGVMMTNTDANACYVKFGTSASSTSFTVTIPANGYWEMPKPIYRGAITGNWAADGSGAMIITEM